MVLETDILLPDNLVFIYLHFFPYPHGLRLNNQTVSFQINHSGKGVNSSQDIV